MKDRWTNQDQHHLDALNERRNRLMKINFAPLLEAVKLTDLLGSPNDERLAEALMANADRFRDALEPFDTGVRMAETPSPIE